MEFTEGSIGSGLLDHGLPTTIIPPYNTGSAICQVFQKEYVECLFRWLCHILLSIIKYSISSKNLKKHLVIDPYQTLLELKYT